MLAILALQYDFKINSNSFKVTEVSKFNFPYEINPLYKKKVAYVCMEFGIDQALKTYAGGLGYLAGSHMRSAFNLQQNVIGIGILWKYGYYDQLRKQDRTMEVAFEEKYYGFLEKTDIKFTIKVSKHDVWVTAYYLAPNIFNTAPIFFLTTELTENDYLAKTITHRLYDANPETRIAASILLGQGTAKLLECINWEPDVFHLNESHVLPLAYYLYDKYKNIDLVKNKIVFTTHTPEEAGNQKTNMLLLDKMGFFSNVPLTEVHSISKIENNELNHTLTMMYLSRVTNGVSKMHLNTLIQLWKGLFDTSLITSITNAQDFNYWNDSKMYDALKKDNNIAITNIKQARKKALFEIVADQCGEIFDEKICTLVFAKRFTDYKRLDIFFHDMEKFELLITNQKRPLQIIWAGKPYPMDYEAIGIFNKIVELCKSYKNCAILVGYELKLSKLLKGGADIWLNTPRVNHEASGTSGMTAAMNGAVNVSTADGWFPEFSKDKVNSFLLPITDTNLPIHLQDDTDAANLYHLLNTEILPIYYDYPEHWISIKKQSMKDIIPTFDSNRLAKEYYDKIYNNS